MRTHYDNLQVSRNASPRVIRAAYKTLAQEWHPDKYPNDRKNADEVLRFLNRSYGVLSDPVKRREYDRWIDRKAAERALQDTGRVNRQQTRATGPRAEPTAPETVSDAKTERESSRSLESEQPPRPQPRPDSRARSASAGADQKRPSIASRKPVLGWMGLSLLAGVSALLIALGYDSFESSQSVNQPLIQGQPSAKEGMAPFASRPSDKAAASSVPRLSGHGSKTRASLVDGSSARGFTSGERYPIRPTPLHGGWLLSPGLSSQRTILGGAAAL